MSRAGPGFSAAKSEEEEEVRKTTPEERRIFLEKWADSNPLGTIESARQQLKEIFGESISTKAISDIMRNARRKMEEAHATLRAQESADQLTPIDKSRELPAIIKPRSASDSRIIAMVAELEHLEGPAFYQAIGNLLKKAGLRRVEIKPDDTISVDFKI